MPAPATAPAQTATVAATAYDATLIIHVNAESPPVVAVLGFDITVGFANDAAVTCTAYNTTVALTLNVNPESIIATVVANDTTTANGGAAATAAVTTTAYNASTAFGVSTGSAVVTCTANDVTSAETLHVAAESAAVTVSINEVATGRSSADTGVGAEFSGPVALTRTDTGHATEVVTFSTATLSASETVGAVDFVSSRRFSTADSFTAVEDYDLTFITAPPQRTFTILAETRILTIRPSARVLEIPAEKRVVVVKGGWEGRG